MGDWPFVSTPSMSFPIDRLAGWLNVFDYGAVGDGISDDTSAIQKAVAALPVTGGTVFLPTGTYKITSSITLKSGTTLRGSGMLSTIIKNYGNTDTLYALQSVGGSQYIVVESLQLFDALGIATRTTGHGINFDGTASYTRCVIRDCYVLGHINGINLQRSGYSSLYNCRVVSTKNDGYSASDVSTVNLELTNCGAVACGRYGYYIKDTNYCVINGGLADSNSSHGYFLESTTLVTLNSTSAESNTGDGYRLLTCQKLTFNSVNASGISTQDGVRIDGSSRIVFNNLQVSTVTGFGINCLNSYTDVLSLNDHISGAVAGSVSDGLGRLTRYVSNAFVSLPATAATITTVNAGKVNAGTGSIGSNVSHVEANNASNYVAYIANSASAGTSYGLELLAGGNASDYALLVADRTSNVVFFQIRGDGLPILNGGGRLFSTLPTATAAERGAIVCVTDSATAVWGSTITGGSTNTVLAFCDGVAWTVCGK